MKQLIRQVLDDMADGQVNLTSKAAREMIATTITATLKTKGSYKEYIEYELDEQKARESWVCSICGKNTYDVDWEYIGSDTNHLGCELEHEKRVTSDRRKEDRREKNWSQKKHEDKVFHDQTEKYKKEKEKAKQFIDKSVEDYEKNVLSEEIVSDNDIGYIYESPDGGKTVYKRKEGSDKRELVKNWEKVKNNE